MRKLLTLVLVVLTASFGTPSVGLAQSSWSGPLGSISGETVDAGGRALVNQRVELLRGSEVLNSMASGSRGEWSFANVAPGDYVVRTVVNGKIAGIRVSVTSGQVARALIVAPSAAAPSAAFLAALGLLGGSLVAAGVAAVIITTVVVVTGS